MTEEELPFVSAGRMRALLRPRDAVESIERALRGGLDPAADPARTVVGMRRGQLLLMPSEAVEHAGVKVVSVAPGNPALGRPRIQGVYLLVDADSLAPLAVLDGTALTTLRTPAVSLAAIGPALLLSDAPLRVAVFGAGPQAIAHVETVLDVVAPSRPVASVTYLVRRPDAAAVPQLAGIPVRLQASSGGESQRVVGDAGLIVCATTTREPLFDGRSVRDDAVVVAVGSHEPDAREVDGTLVARAQVVVEDLATATREAGDVVQAIGEGRLRPEDLVPMSEVVTRRVQPSAGRPLLFKSTGMAWEDLVVASAVHRRWSAAREGQVTPG